MTNASIRVLLVDDRKEDYLLTERLLAKIPGKNYDVTWISTYQDALSELDCSIHDICLVDYKLGAGTGLDLVRAATSRQCGVPIILLTGHGDEQIDAEATEAGAMDYLVKGQITSELLERTIRYSLKHSQTLSQVRQYASELEARNAELDSFSYTVAHDLKSPLTAIIGYLAILEDESTSLSTDGYECLAQSLSMAWRMESIIRSLLTLAQLKEDVEPSHVDMNEVVRSVVRRVDRPLTQRRVTVSIDEALPVALGYAPWIEEIFANLIENAIKYIGRENKDPRISIRGYQRDGSGSQVRFEVQDNGLGIRPQDIERLTEMFSRFHSTEAQGFGLGLSIIKRILARLDGQFGVESTYGQGSTFWFSLPAAQF